MMIPASLEKDNLVLEEVITKTVEIACKELDAEVGMQKLQIAAWLIELSEYRKMAQNDAR